MLTRATLLALALACALGTPTPSLLFIIVDDLRAQLGGPFGQSTLTPNLNGLAARGVSFTRAYVQVSVCSPSRTSMLTGMRPDATRLWTIGPYFRNTSAGLPIAGAAIKTLPQLLREAGTPARGAGKVWHPGTSSGGDPAWGGGGVGGDDMPASWSYAAPPGVDPRLLFWECDAWANSTGQSPASAGIPGGSGCVTSPACVACLQAHNGTRPAAVMVTPCADECYVDRMVSDYVAGQLAAAGGGAGAPPLAFFAGLKRPHLGFQLPLHAWQAYAAAQPLAASRAPPAGMPPAGWYTNAEVTGLPDVREYVLPNATFPGLLDDAVHARLRRAYYGCVSWMDAQLGAILDALDASGRAESTWVTFIGDHGWALGEHGNWAKQQLFEHALRVPLIIAPPRGAAGWRAGATVGPPHIVEALDLYPTIAELLGVAPPQGGQLAGRSLVPFLRAGPPPPPPPPGAPRYAYSQIVRADGRRCSAPDAAAAAAAPGDSDPPALAPLAPGAPPCLMGLSVRAPGWRYTAWLNYSYSPPAGGGGAYGPQWDQVAGEELYNHTASDGGGGSGADAGLSYDDASEDANLAQLPELRGKRAELLQALKLGFPQRQG
jgi:iduronate 2-sulfatase